jgi:hypothetical protein
LLWRTPNIRPQKMLRWRTQTATGMILIISIVAWMEYVTFGLCWTRLVVIAPKMMATQPPPTSTIGHDDTVTNDATNSHKSSSTTLLNRTTTTTNNSNNHKNMDGPIAILHFGPRKTATTTIQFALTQNHSQQLLARDSLVYLGKNVRGQKSFYRTMARPHIFDCWLRNKRCNTTAPHWNTFVQQVEQERLLGHHVILSDEGLHRFSSQVSHDTFHQFVNVFSKFSHIRIVLGYRRLFEWMVSEYNQQMKDGSAAKLDFVDWYHTTTQRHSDHDSTAPNKFFSLLEGATLQRYQTDVTNDISIFNLHDSSSSSTNAVMANVLCHTIPEAHHACEAARTGTLVAKDQEEPLMLSISHDEPSTKWEMANP